MRQIVRVKSPLTHEVAERLAQAGIHLKAGPPPSTHSRPPASFIAEVDAASEVQALQVLRGALEPWREVLLEPLGPRGWVGLPPNNPLAGSEVAASDLGGRSKSPDAVSENRQPPQAEEEQRLEKPGRPEGLGGGSPLPPGGQ
jgi:hypothetical protein